LLVYEQYLNDIEEDSDTARTNSNSVVKIKIKNSIEGYYGLKSYFWNTQPIDYFADSDDILELNQILRKLKRAKNDFVKDIRILFRYHLESKFEERVFVR